MSLPEVSLGDEGFFSCIDYLEKRNWSHIHTFIQLDNQVLKEDGVPWLPLTCYSRSTHSDSVKPLLNNMLSPMLPSSGKVLPFSHSSFLRATKELGRAEPTVAPPEVPSNCQEQKGLSAFIILLVFLGDTSFCTTSSSYIWFSTCTCAQCPLQISFV